MAEKRNIVLSVIFRALVCVVLLVAASAIFWILANSRPQPERVNQSGLLPRVVVMQAEAVPVKRQWEGFGTAAAMDSADVPARVSATVESIPDRIMAGTSVEKGELLLRLDDSDFVRQVEIITHTLEDLESQLVRLNIESKSWGERLELAQEQVTLARAEYARVTEALAKGAARQREVDQAQAALLGAIRDETATREESDKLAPRRVSLESQKLAQEAQLRLASQNVQRCEIVSPLKGVLQSVEVEVGESLGVGQRVARVVDLSRIEVRLLLPASARSGLRLGDEVALRSAGSADEKWRASVARIAPEDDQATRTMALYVEVRQKPDDPGGLAPGQFVRGLVSSSTNNLRWVVPRRALAGERIYLIDDGRVVSRVIDIDFQIERTFPELGLTDVQWVVLREPLNEGDQVVVNGSRSLSEGMAAQAVIAGGGGGTGSAHAGEEAK